MKYFNHKETTFLLGCYMVIADKEINSLELAVLDQYIPRNENENVYTERAKIFSDEETRIRLQDLVDSVKFGHYSIDEKVESLRLLIQVAYGDDYFARSEKELVEWVSSALGIDCKEYVSEAALESEERLSAERMSGFKRTVGKIYNKIAEKAGTENTESLFGSLGYSADIEQITDDACVDLQRVKNVTDKINLTLSSVCENLRQSKVVKADKSKEVEEVSKVVRETIEHFEVLINVSLADNKTILEKKERNIRYLTIAFMGRTKAGKSTLHKVVTLQKNDDTGVGKLRTTRYNRSWYWERLRVVDTPGIGAPGGEADAEIAKSIIDEADIICYIVTSDSIQETEFDFFSTIKDRNKPLYVLLNVKSNLTQSIRLKKFLKDPTNWLHCDGPQSIQGHIDRIHERLDGKYNMDAVDIVPIHLLAAQLAHSGEYDKETSVKLLEGSNIMEFIKLIKSGVHNSGSLKKSLSVIDGTAYQINKICQTIGQANAQLKDANDTLKKKKDKFKSFLKRETMQLDKDIKTIFKGAKDELHNRASAFAGEHYDDKNAGKAWQNDATVKNIYKRAGRRVRERMDDFNEKLKDELNEISSDIQIHFNSSASGNGISGESITNTRLGAGIVGTIVSAAVPFAISNIWNPAGWVVGLSTVIVGIVVSIITSLFTSKAEKIRKATDNLRVQLDESIDKSVEKNLTDCVQNINNGVNKSYRTIERIFTTYIDNTDIVIHKIDDLFSECSLNEKAINSLVGFRILEYANGKVPSERKINEMSNSDILTKYPVTRDWEKQSITYNYEAHLSDKSRKKAKAATQMSIILGSVVFYD